MKTLKRIRLINWHYLTNLDLPVDGSLYLFGENEAGKTSILDALQFVLVADRRRTHFNASAQMDGPSDRNLESYVCCKVGETYERAAATAYIALEFEEHNAQFFVIGTVIDARVGGGEPDTAFFVLNNCRIDDSLFLNGTQPYSRREFLNSLRNHPDYKPFTSTSEYQDYLRTRFGQLGPRFFDLLIKAFSFKPMGDIRDFVYNYLLDKEMVEIDTMRHTQEELAQLSKIADTVERQVKALLDIIQSDTACADIQRTINRHQYFLCHATADMALEAVADHHRQTDRLKTGKEQASIELEQVEAQHQSVQAAFNRVQTSLNQDARYQLRQKLREKADELHRDIQQGKQQRQAVLQAMAQEQRRLAQCRALLLPANPAPDLLAVLDEFLAWSPEALMAQPTPTETDSILNLLTQTRQALRDLNSWARKEYAQLEIKRDSLKAEAKKVGDELEGLRRGERLRPPDQAERLRQLLVPQLKQTPPYLYELLELADESWHNAVEGLLGNRRFDLLIPPEHFEACARLYEDQGRQQGIHGVRLVDLQRIKMQNPQARPNSLARQIIANGDAAAYINHLLGDTITCDLVTELRQHHRSVTRTGMIYNNFALDHLNPSVYEKWFIGQHARNNQISCLEAELDQLSRELQTLTEPLEQWQQRVSQTTAPDTYAGWLHLLPGFALLAEKEKTLADTERQLQETDWTEIEKLQAQQETLRSQLGDLSEHRRDLDRQLATLEAQLNTHLLNSPALQHWQLETRQQLTELEANKTGDEVESWRKSYAEERRKYTPTRIIEVYTSQQKGYQTQLDNTRKTLHNQQTEFHKLNLSFRIPADPDDITPYRQELERLQSTELPNFRQQIERARQEAEQEFKENFIHQLREKIGAAQKHINDLNDALKQVDFSGTNYRFICNPHPEYQLYYDLIVNKGTEMMGMPLLEGLFYEQNQSVIDELFEKLTGQSDGSNPAVIERLRDYRSYLTYDIELHHQDGRRERFSKVARQQSGGKTQSPYYVAMVAAFAQLYRIHNPRLNDTVRLIIFDEAFNRMDHVNTAGALELMHRYQLQVITATPTRRYEEIAPHMNTNVYLKRVDNQVIAIPYFNYRQKIEGQEISDD